MTKLTLEALNNASQGTYGNISAIARKLQVSRSTLYEFINSNPKARKQIESLRAEFDDLAEEKIQKSILEGDRALLRLYAARKLNNHGGKEKTPAPAPEVRVHLLTT